MFYQWNFNCTSMTGPVLLQVQAKGNSASLVDNISIKRRVTATSLLQEVRSLAEQGVSLDNVSLEILSSMSTELNKTVLVEILEGHEEDQAKMHEMRDFVHGCDPTYIQEQQASDEIRLLNKTRQEHMACRSNESGLRKENETSCTAAHKDFMGFSSAVCVRQSQSNIPSEAEIDAFLLHLRGTKTLRKECSDADRSLGDAIAACHLKQALFEQAACSYASALESACENYGACRSDRIAVYNSEKARVQRMQATRKLDFAALQHVFCYLEVLSFRGSHGMRQDMFDSCKAMSVDTSPLDIDFNLTAVGEPVPCQSLSSGPCDVAWTDSEYGGLPRDAPAGPCRACGATTATTTTSMEKIPATTAATTTATATTKLGLARCSSDSGYGVYDFGKDELYLNANGASFSSDFFCNSDISTIPLPPNHEYSISLNMYNIRAWKGVNSGHLGIGWNAVDMDNYDWVYFRPHSDGRCFQTGQMIEGAPGEKNKKSASCNGGGFRGGVWINIKVIVGETHAMIYKDDKLIHTQKSYFPQRASGTMIVANGYKNEARFKDLRVSLM